MLALVLMLNGVQVDLPTPAYLVGENAFVPARAVFEKLGYPVAWNPAQGGELSISKGSAHFTLVLGSNVLGMPGPMAVPLPAASRMIGNVFYVPVRAVSLITGAATAWDAAHLTVSLNTTNPPMPVRGEPVSTNLGQILSDPPAWAGRLVLVRGEYTGWQADPYGPATSQGPPVTRSDWALADATGSIYCSASGPAGIPFSPLGDLGRRVDVTGVVALSDKGCPYLQVTGLAPLTGLEGLTRFVTTDRRAYQPGDTVHIGMLVANPGEESLMVNTNSGKTYDFQVLNAEGEVVWAWSQGKVFTMALQSRELKAGEKYTVTAEWTVPANLPAGPYHVRGELNAELRSYPHTLSLAKEEPQ
jgi:hypothetical protein